MLKILFLLLLISVPAFANTLTANKVVMTESSAPGISPTTEDSDITDIKGTSVSVGVPLTVSGLITVGGDIYTNDWQDYSSTMTFVGWSSLSSKIIYVKKIGKLVFVSFYLNGTSNATTVSFSLPYTISTTQSLYVSSGQCQDNTSTLTTPSLIQGTAGYSGVTIYKDMSASTLWTASGNKIVTGQFWFQQN